MVTRLKIDRYELKEKIEADWAAENPILHSNEPGCVKGQPKFKLGDGVTPWLGLEYFIAEGDILAMIEEKIAEAVFEGVDLGTEYTQLSPSASWSIPVPAGMGRRPNVTVYDASGKLVLADVNATDIAVNITFPSPMTGSVVLS